MKVRHMAIGFAAGAAISLSAQSVLSQDAQEMPPGMDAQAMEMMQALQTAHDNPTEPSSFHKALDQFIGEWDVTVRIFMMGPDAPPMESKGTSTFKWLLGKRFVQETMSAELNMGGMSVPLDSIIMTGYDNYTNQYVGAMIGSGSTEMIIMKGSAPLDGKTFHQYGEMHEPMMNITGRLIRVTTEIIDANHHTVTVYDLHAGEDYIALQFSYSRKK